jgi:hypothetical protein
MLVISKACTNEEKDKKEKENGNNYVLYASYLSEEKAREKAEELAKEHNAPLIRV